MKEKAKTSCVKCGRGLIVPIAHKDKKLLCKACREAETVEETLEAAQTVSDERTIAAENTVDAPPTFDSAETIAAQNDAAVGPAGDSAPTDRDSQDTVRLGKSVAATKLIKEVLKVEPTVDLDHFLTMSSRRQTELKPGASAPSVRDIISHAQAETKYIVDRTIGKGGMGAVLSTVDQDIRRKVAMKVMLSKDSADTPKVKRFLEEAQITGQLEHPNIVPVHEIGIDEDSKIYFTMKLVQGENLETILANCENNVEDYSEKFSLGNLIQLFMKLCDGISYAHSKGVIHRDLKPENIMIGSFGEVLVMDWGIAKIIGQKDTVAENSVSQLEDSAKHTQTMEGIVLGTPAYMPPEQAWGHISELDERSDIFSLGAILYKILTLKAPYEGQNLMAVLQKAQNRELVSPDIRTPQKNIPAELNAICLKALAYEQEKRYGSVLELKRDLQLYLDGKSVSAKKDNLFIRTKKWILRNKIASMGIAAAVICLVAGVVATSIYENRKRQETIAGMLRQGETLSENGQYEAAEKTYFAVLGLDSSNQHAREGVARVSSKALAQKNKRLAVKKAEEAGKLFQEKNYIKAYDAYVATLTLDPFSQEALDGIKTTTIMAEKQKVQMKIAPILKQAETISTKKQEMQTWIQSLKNQKKDLSDQIEGYEGADVKIPFWNTEKKLFESEVEDQKTESELISNYLKILSYDGANEEARKSLTQLYYEKYLAGEMNQDEKAMAYYKALVLTFDDGQYGALLEKPGSLTVTAQPVPDAFYLFRFLEGTDRRMIPVPFSSDVFQNSPKEPEASFDSGIDPKFDLQNAVFNSLDQVLAFKDFNRLHQIDNILLPAGSYLLVLKKNGFLEARLPVMVYRGETKKISNVKLFRKEEVPEGFVYIPRGEFVMGGDAKALNALDRSVPEIPGYFIAQHETTAEEYLQFINYLESRIPGSAQKYLPRKSVSSGFYWNKKGKHYQNAFPDKWPILGVSWNDARAYCQYMTRRHKKQGWSFRLPEEWEWEKAARGVDGRYFPWGNYFDYKFCMMAQSKKGTISGPEPVGSFPLDESVYGVKDIAGNVSEWCNTLYDKKKNIRINRGAAWSYVEENYARCAYRNGHGPSDVADFRGFRMVVTVGD